MEKRALQVILGVLSLIPLVGLVIGFGPGAKFFATKGSTIPVDLDNQFRYLSGVYTFVTVGAWYIIWDIERRGDVFRLIALAIFVGAIGRALSMIFNGIPKDQAMIVGLGLEAVVVPLLALWQTRIAKQSKQSKENRSL